jgi:hypothetical protein
MRVPPEGWKILISFLQVEWVRNEGASRLCRQDISFQGLNGLIYRILNGGAEERNTVFCSISEFTI